MKHKRQQEPKEMTQKSIKCLVARKKNTNEIIEKNVCTIELCLDVNR